MATETKWTPGPWLFGAYGCVWPASDVGRDLAGKWVERVPEPRIIASPSPLPEAEANNRLIAAAPDLAEALHNALVLLRALTGPDDAIAVATLDAGNAALSKARGEA